MKSQLTPFALLAAFALACSGCTLLAASGDIDDGGAERTSAKDHDERMRRLRENGTLRPDEYDALREKMGDGSAAGVSPKPSVEELEERVKKQRDEQDSVQ